MYRPATAADQAQPAQGRVVYLRDTPHPWAPIVLASAAGSLIGMWAWSRLTAASRARDGRR